MAEKAVLLELQVVRLLNEEAAAGRANDRESHYFLMHPSFFDDTDNIWGHIRGPLCLNRAGSTAVVCLEGAASSLCSSIQSHVQELLAGPDIAADSGLIRVMWEIEIVEEHGAGEPAGPGPSISSSSSVPAAAGDDGGEKVCVVCMEKLRTEDPTAILPCLHQYHEDCILQWLQQSRTCPLCRFMLPPFGWCASTFHVRSGDDDSPV